MISKRQIKIKCMWSSGGPSCELCEKNLDYKDNSGNILTLKLVTYKLSSFSSLWKICHKIVQDSLTMSRNTKGEVLGVIWNQIKRVIQQITDFGRKCIPYFGFGRNFGWQTDFGLAEAESRYQISVSGQTETEIKS